MKSISHARLEVSLIRCSLRAIGCFLLLCIACAKEGSTPNVSAPNNALKPSASTSQTVPASTWETERIGALSAGSPASLVEELLGKNAEKSSATHEQATGEFASSWEFKSQGVSLMMAATKTDGPFHVRLLIVQAPCTWKTRRGIAVGSSITDVKRAYANLINSEGAHDKLILIGPIFGGLKFYLNDAQRVERIAIGSDGE